MGPASSAAINNDIRGSDQAVTDPAARFGIGIQGTGLRRILRTRNPCSLANFIHQSSVRTQQREESFFGSDLWRPACAADVRTGACILLAVSAR